jgi:hypothetical protein
VDRFESARECMFGKLPKAVRVETHTQCAWDTVEEKGI